MPFKADVADRGQVDAMVKSGIERFRAIDILVNNAAGGSTFLMEDMPYEVWD